MKKIILLASLFLSSSAFAGVHVLILRDASESKLQQVVRDLNAGRYRGNVNDNCGFSKRKVYAVTVSEGYRVGPHGDLQPTTTATIKYRCGGGGDR